MNNNLLKKVIKKYGFRNFELLSSSKGYRNYSFAFKASNNSLLNLILYKKEVGILATINRANKVSNFLAQKGLNTRMQFGKVLVLNAGGNKRYLCLYNYLAGNTISWEAYTMEHLKELGKHMSNLHFELLSADISSWRLLNILDLLKKDLDNMVSYFADSGVISALKSKLDLSLELDLKAYFKDLFKALEAEESTGVLHMDFVRGNILFDVDKKVSGILDFEKVAFGPRVVDIARTLAFLIVDTKFKTEVKVRKYFLQSGYGKRGKLALPDLRNLEKLVIFFWLYDFFKFLKYNPYEFLMLNQHFERTKQKLLDLKILS